MLLTFVIFLLVKKCSTNFLDQKKTIILVFGYRPELTHTAEEISGVIAGLLGFNLFEGLNLNVEYFHLNANLYAGSVPEERIHATMDRLNEGGYDAVGLFDDYAMETIGIPYYSNFTTPVFYSEMSGIPEYFNDSVHILDNRETPGGNWTGVLCENFFFHTLEMFSYFFDLKNTFVPILLEDTVVGENTYFSLLEESKMKTKHHEFFLTDNNITLEIYRDISQYDDYKSIIVNKVEGRPEVKVYFPWVFGLKEGERKVDQYEIVEWTVQNVLTAAEMTQQSTCKDGFFGGAQSGTFEMARMMGHQMGRFLVDNEPVSEMEIEVPPSRIYFNRDRVEQLKLEMRPTAEALLNIANGYGNLYSKPVVVVEPGESTVEYLTAVEVSAIVIGSIVSLAVVVIICTCCALFIFCFCSCFFVTYTLSNALFGSVSGICCCEIVQIGVIGLGSLVSLFGWRIWKWVRKNKELRELDLERIQELEENAGMLVMMISNFLGISEEYVDNLSFCVRQLKGFPVSSIRTHFQFEEMYLPMQPFDPWPGIYAEPLAQRRDAGVDEEGNRVPDCDIFLLKEKEEGEVVKKIKRDYGDYFGQKNRVIRADDFVVKWFHDVDVGNVRDVKSDVSIAVSKEDLDVKRRREHVVEIVALAIRRKTTQNNEKTKEADLIEHPIPLEEEKKVEKKEDEEKMERQEVVDIAIVMERGKGGSLEKYLGRYLPINHQNNLQSDNSLGEEGHEGFIVEAKRNVSSGGILPFIPNNLDLKIRILMRICQIMSYLHTVHKVIHLDLKADNLVLMEEPQNNQWNDLNLNILDFGKCEKMENAEKKGTALKWSGTPGYHVPGESPVTKKCDVFSFGVLMYAILFCLDPAIDLDNVPIIQEKRERDLESDQFFLEEYQKCQKKVYGMIRRPKSGLNENENKEMDISLLEGKLLLGESEQKKLKELRSIILHCTNKNVEERWEDFEEIELILEGLLKL